MRYASASRPDRRRRGYGLSSSDLICIDARHAKPVLKIQRPQRCYRDRPHHADRLVQGSDVKDIGSHSVGALLVKIKRDLEDHVRGLLKNLGLIIGRAKFNVFVPRVEELIEDRPALMAAVRPLLEGRNAIERQVSELDRRVMKLARRDACENTTWFLSNFNIVLPSPTLARKSFGSNRLFATFGMKILCAGLRLSLAGLAPKQPLTQTPLRRRPQFASTCPRIPQIRAVCLFMFYAWLPLLYALIGFDVGLLLGRAFTRDVGTTAIVLGFASALILGAASCILEPYRVFCSAFPAASCSASCGRRFRA